MSAMYPTLYSAKCGDKKRYICGRVNKAYLRKYKAHMAKEKRDITTATKKRAAIIKAKKRNKKLAIARKKKAEKHKIYKENVSLPFYLILFIVGGKSSRMGNGQSLRGRLK